MTTTRRMASRAVTLAFGRGACETAAHFWNIRDDDADGSDVVDWAVDHAERGGGARTSVSDGSSGGHRWVPRYVAFDLSGRARIGTGGREDARAGGSAWDGDVATFRAPATRRSSYARALDREARALANEARVRALTRGEDEEDELELGRRKLGGVGRALELRATGRAPMEPLDDPEDVLRELIEAAAKLDVEVEGWSDYLKVELSERSIFPLVGKWTGIDAFEGFGEGVEWIESEDRREDVRDAIRYWVEECDSLGGFRVLCDDSSGFGGVCARALEDVRDDYNNRTVCVFSTRHPAVKERKRVDMLNSAFAATLLAGSCDLYCPLGACNDYPGMPGAREGSWFHSTAIAALALEGITTPWRLKREVTGATSMHDMCKFMTSRAPGPHATAQAAVCPRVRSTADTDVLKGSMRSVTPGQRRANDDDEDTPFSEFFVARGIAEDATVVDSVLDAWMSRELYRCPRRRCIVDAEIPIPLPYPRLFSPRDPSSVSSMVRLTTSSATARDLDAIHRDFSRASTSSMGKAMLAAWSLDGVERAETIESLMSSARAYAGDTNADDF